MTLLYRSDSIQTKVLALADRIDEWYGDREVIAVVVMNGAMFFATDLLRSMKTPIQVASLGVKSYFGEVRSTPIVHSYNGPDVGGRDILIIEDIVDTGHTLAAVNKYLSDQFPRSIKSVAMLDKPERREVIIDPTWHGFNVGKDDFVYGYGLDYCGGERSLPDVHVHLPEMRTLGAVAV